MLTPPRARRATPRNPPDRVKDNHPKDHPGGAALAVRPWVSWVDKIRVR